MRLGDFEVRLPLRLFVIALLFICLTAITQIGGLAYLLGRSVRFAASVKRSAPSVRFTAVALAAISIYLASTVFLVPPLAKSMGRVRLPCGTNGEGPVVAATWLTCALNRGYVRPEVRELVMALGREVRQRFPGSQVTTLEGNFPFLDGFPLLPHLSHRDGRKVDIAYFYRSAIGDAAIPHGSPSWLGYFIYEQPGQGEPEPCSRHWTPLRWDFNWLQPRSPSWRLDEQRTAWTVSWLKNQPQVSRIFIEPYLAQRLGVAGGKVHFQGCHAARHDDHIHVEVL